MESEKKKICPKCGCEDGSGQNNIHSMNPEHFCKCPIRSIMERDGVCYSCAFWIINGSVCPAITGEAGYSKEEFDKVNKENKDPELESINSFNDTVKKANEIKDRVLKYVDKIKQERAYNIDLCMTFERYIEIADKDAERAMAFLKEAYPFNEETEVFIRKRYNMSIDVDPEEN